MKKMTRFIPYLILITFLLFLLPQPVYAQGPVGENDWLVLGDSYQLASGKSLDHDLVIIGGLATLQKDSTVNGNVFIVGGSLTVSGKINGEITLIGGTISLDDTAYVTGNIDRIGGAFTKSPQATILGHINENAGNNGNFPIPPIPPNPPVPPSVTEGKQLLNNTFTGLFGQGFTTLTQALVLAILAALVMLFLLKPAERVARTIVVQPVLSAGLGLLTIIVAPALLLLLIITIILSPLGIIGAIAIAASVLLGWIAFGLEIGKRLASMFKVEWAPPIGAGIGTLLLTLVTFGIGWIPCLGWIAPFLVCLMAIGGVILSRFGTRVYEPGVGPSVPHAPVSTPVKDVVSLDAHPAQPETPPVLSNEVPPEPQDNSSASPEDISGTAEDPVVPQKPRSRKPKDSTINEK